MPLLDSIHAPADVRKLSLAQLSTLAQEMRERIFTAVSKNGGHLASNLGVVELTLALHYVYDFGAYPAGPDRLLWDVGHQSYPHKLLTGRAAQFDRLRKKGSVSGFPSPHESPYDLFAVGHAGTAISTAVGMATRRWAPGSPEPCRRGGRRCVDRQRHGVRRPQQRRHAQAADADRAERQRHEHQQAAGRFRAIPRARARQRNLRRGQEVRRAAWSISCPRSVERTIEGAWHAFRDGVKGAMWPVQMFEGLGIKYLGPIDGHDLPGLINTLAEIKHVQAPVLLHVKTVKGQGYEIAVQRADQVSQPRRFPGGGMPGHDQQGDAASPGRRLLPTP